MIDMSQEKALAEVLCEITRNIHAAAALAGILASEGNEGMCGRTAKDAFRYADAMMGESRLPRIIEALNQQQQKKK